MLLACRKLHRLRYDSTLGYLSTVESPGTPADPDAEVVQRIARACADWRERFIITVHGARVRRMLG
ncbi:MAG: hypothetical protein FJX76_11715 [Armatimonadetes bacterium]|nr:hypothetical protein [Armatimonadota bacterium]